MNSFDFSYYQPDTLEEAFNCYQNLDSESKTVLYYSGGSEIISMARTESIKFHAVIDLKGIPECNTLELRDQNLVIGSTQSLTNIAEADYFPLMSKTVSRIADHTMQGKITIGGNLAGTIIYREASLPLLISSCQALLMTRVGLQQMPFSHIFDGRLQLKKGEFLVQLLIDGHDLHLPSVHVKKTKMDKIDYPLMTMAGRKKNGCIQAAVSGLGETPVILPADQLNDPSRPVEQRIAAIIAQLGSFIKSDISGSKEYREFVLTNIIIQMFANLEEA